MIPCSIRVQIWPCISLAGKQTVSDGMVCCPLMYISRFERGEVITSKPRSVKKVCQRGAVHTYLSPLATPACPVAGNRLIAEQGFQFKVIHIWNRLLLLFTQRLVAAVTANKFLLAAERVDGQSAVVIAQPAGGNLDIVGEMLKFFQANQVGLEFWSVCFLPLHGVHSCAKSAHQSRNIRADDVDLQLLFQTHEAPRR